MSAQYNKSIATLIITCALTMYTAAKAYDARPSNFQWIYPQTLKKNSEIKFSWRFHLSPSYYSFCEYKLELYFSENQTLSSNDHLFYDSDTEVPSRVTGFTETTMVRPGPQGWSSLPENGTYYVFLKLSPGLGAPPDNNMFNNMVMAPNPIQVGEEPAINPNPTNGSIEQPLNLVLSWSDGGGATSYDVYFGTDSTPDSTEYKGNQTSTTYNPGTLYYGTTYYWRIDAKNAQGATRGNTWRFTTMDMVPGPCPTILIPDRKDHVFDPVNQILYITTQSGTVERYDVTTKELLHPWTIGGTLGSVDVTPYGDTVLVADRSYDTTTNVGYIHRVDVLSGIVTTLEFPLYGGQHSFTETGSWDVIAMNNGKAFFTADFVGSAWVPLHELDLATDTIVDRSSSTFSGFNGVRERTWLFRDANHSVMLGLESDSSSGPVFSYITDTDSFIAGADLGFYPGETSRSIFHSNSSGSISRDGQWLAIEIEPTNEVWILDLALSIIATKLSGIEGGVIFDPYQDLLYGLDTVNDEVIVFDTNSWFVIERIAVCEDLLATQRFDGSVLSFDPLNSTVYVSVSGGILPIKIESTGSTEDFETNDFNKFPWEHEGDSHWTTISWEKHSKNYSAQAGPIDHDESTSLNVTLNCVSGNITFYRRVSSESDFDFLRFYIDGVENGDWSGEEDWTEVSFPVTAGTRTFEWTYSKDGSVSEGDDTAWIDDIVFPVVGGSELPPTPPDDQIAVEDFETNDFNKFPWEHEGDSHWTTISWEKHSGNYSAQAGSIDHDESTTLNVTLDCVSGNITFYRKVSSESDFDCLRFYIDGVENGDWSGEEDWAAVSFPVTAGTRTFEWIYSKDGSVSSGDDTAWIDNIALPVREAF